jgi:hypothetical protein
VLRDQQEPRAKDWDACQLPCRLAFRCLDELRPHPSYLKHKFSVSASHLAVLCAAGHFALQLPIIVTQTGIIIDGYARCELARRQGRDKIACLEYDLSDEEALLRLIQSHSPSKGLNGFSRSLLALDLEPSLQEKAHANQQIGGERKGCSDLTEAQKVDVRSKIAAFANVSTGNITKAKQVVTHSHPVIQQVAKSGEISVHRAWQWSRLSHEQQLEKLEEFRSCKGVGLVSRQLIQKHVARMIPTRLVPPTLGDILKPLTPDRMAALDAVVVSEIDAPGRIAYFTKDAIDYLQNAGGT